MQDDPFRPSLIEYRAPGSGWQPCEGKAGEVMTAKAAAELLREREAAPAATGTEYRVVDAPGQLTHVVEFRHGGAPWRPWNAHPGTAADARKLAGVLAALAAGTGYAYRAAAAAVGADRRDRGTDEPGR